MTPARLKLITIVAGVLLGAAVLLTWTREWFFLVLEPAAPLSVSGQSAAPALSGLGLAVLALSGALAIAKPVVRAILGVVQALLGVIVLVIASTALGGPLAASHTAITEATGIAGSAVESYVVSEVTVSLWPWVAAVAGVLLVLLGLWVLVTGRRWPSATDRYESSSSSTTSTAGAWDSLSGGDDPTASPR